MGLFEHSTYRTQLPRSSGRYPSASATLHHPLLDELHARNALRVTGFFPPLLPPRVSLPSPHYFGCRTSYAPRLAHVGFYLNTTTRLSRLLNTVRCTHFKFSPPTTPHSTPRTLRTHLCAFLPRDNLPPPLPPPCCAATLLAPPAYLCHLLRAPLRRTAALPSPAPRPGSTAFARTLHRTRLRHCGPPAFTPTLPAHARLLPWTTTHYSRTDTHHTHVGVHFPPAFVTSVGMPGGFPCTSFALPPSSPAPACHAPTLLPPRRTRSRIRKHACTHVVLHCGCWWDCEPTFFY